MLPAAPEKETKTLVSVLYLVSVIPLIIFSVTMSFEAMTTASCVSE